MITTGGIIAWHHSATLWGNSQVSPEPGNAACPIRFPGQYHDPETGLNYNYHRYYDSTNGRYNTADPLGLAPAHNAYAYVPNPTGWIDPLGLACQANYTRQSARHVYTHGHAANAPRIPGKSRFRVTEGGQKFTDEVLNHPNVRVDHQTNGRIRHTVDDLGRGPVGWDRHGNPAPGGQVIVEGPNPAQWSTYSPREVVTQYPT
ncbi:MAG: RHS repeat-associated core domain-containing protein [Pseudonocardiales bacterium]